MTNKSCNRNFYVTYANRKLNVGDDFKKFKIIGKATKACNPKGAFNKVMKGKRGFDVEVLETDRLISKTIKGKVIEITRFGNKVR